MILDISFYCLIKVKEFGFILIDVVKKDVVKEVCLFMNDVGVDVVFEVVGN